MSKTGEIPYTWEQVEDGIRAAIWAQACILADFGPLNDLEMTARYLGLSEEPESFDATEIPAFDLTRHALYHRVKAAYLYAYQLDGSESVAGDYDLYVDTITLLEGFPQAGHQGDSSPLHPEVDAPLASNA